MAAKAAQASVCGRPT